MKLLLLTNKVPYPARDGSTIAVKSMVAGLLENGCEVHLLAINTLKHFKEDDEIQNEKTEKLNLYYKTVDTNIKPIGAFKNLLSGDAYHVSRFKNEAITEILVEILQQNKFDFVQIEGIAMAVYLETIKKYSKAKVSLRAHNAEFQIWERHLENESNPLKKWYLNLQNKRLKRFELTVANLVDALITITEEDKFIFKKEGIAKPILTLPCGMDIEPPLKTAKTADITYIASFDWMPNQQGLEWFLKNVYPVLISAKPDIKIEIAGKHQPTKWKQQYPKINFRGWVNDAREFMASGRVAMVPLLAGSGMRIKILDNMALALPMVSTTIGAEGVNLKNNRDILLRDTPEDFAAGLIQLLDDEKLRNDVGKNAYKALQEHYENKKLGAHLLEFYRTLSA